MDVCTGSSKLCMTGLKPLFSPAYARLVHVVTSAPCCSYLWVVNINALRCPLQRCEVSRHEVPDSFLYVGYDETSVAAAAQQQQSWQLVTSC